eukprot:14080500-Ditylum_brightwellii.AAC.1
MWVEAFRTGNVEAASDGKVRNWYLCGGLYFWWETSKIPSTFAECPCPEIPAHIDNSAAFTTNNAEELAPGLAEHTCSDFDILNEIQ